MPLLVLQGAAIGAPAKKGYFGSEWIGKDGKLKQPKLEVAIYRTGDWEQLDSTIYRRPILDSDASNLLDGRYPKSAMRQGKGGVSGAQITISQQGIITACKVNYGSGDNAFDELTCPHLIRNAKFVPALDRRGHRVSYTTSIAAYYTMFEGQVTDWNYGIFIPTVTEKAEPKSEITVQGLGVDWKVTKQNFAVGYRLDVDADGNATGCELNPATMDDMMDFKICSKLVERSKFKPRPGRPVASYKSTLIL